MPFQRGTTSSWRSEQSYRIRLAATGGTAAVVAPLSTPTSAPPSPTSDDVAASTSVSTSSAGASTATSTKLDPFAIALAVIIPLAVAVLLFIIRFQCRRRRQIKANSTPQIVSLYSAGKTYKVELKANGDDDATIAEPAFTYDPHSSPLRLASLMEMFQEKAYS
ncbi:hypothetical protein NLJ89_g11489 [Agrocybe chaxingu]|uniref:Uncharacterized protein n=1 Tax=Agrocybe chaxingu TaxID=84603 RepID=A0A9W8JPV3_9AGAR|nr:hypothetical protein NLJ89_g11489 [Agrocybe chaxingu]